MKAQSRIRTVWDALVRWLDNTFPVHIEEPALCPDCNHRAHDPGKCELLYVYDRPGGPPGNQSCLCGLNIEITPVTLNSNSGTTTVTATVKTTVAPPKDDSE